MFKKKKDQYIYMYIYEYINTVVLKTFETKAVYIIFVLVFNDRFLLINFFLEKQKLFSV